MIYQAARCAILLLMAFPAIAPAAEDVPEWVRSAAAQSTPRYPVKVTSAVLVREESLTVEADGKRVMRERQVVRVLQRGSDPVRAMRYYNTKNGRIRDFQGYLIPASGKPVVYGKDRILDVAVSTDYVYDEARVKVLDFGLAAPGSVIAWEITAEEKSIFTQDAYDFQDEFPVLSSRFTLSLPAAWEARGVIFNHPNIEPVVTGNSYMWELRDLPWIEAEDYSPPLTTRTPRLAISYFPPVDNRAGLQGLKDWTAVSVWVSQFMDPAATVTDAVRAKAQQLTANMADEVEKIRAIAAFTQQTNYVEISLNQTRGGGYTPHSADETLIKNYGDCKDKSTLMRALLKAVGIDAYVTAIYASDRQYVRPEWASPMQFNHAIVAVRVSDAVSLPTVIEDANLGRLLMFDPTDSVTPLGGLPQDEQGSHGLVLAGSRGALLEMPLLPAASNRIESDVEAALDTDGKVNAHIRTQYFGQSGTAWRRIQKLNGTAGVKGWVERIWSGRVGGATVDPIVVADKSDILSLETQLKADRFAQVSQNLLIFRPGVLTAATGYVFAGAMRNSPVRLEAEVRRSSVRMKLPAGFHVEELPESAKIDASYGSFAGTWTQRDGEIVFDQTFEIRESSVAAHEYGALREFFNRARNAEFAPVLLMRR
jgi:transglutaminase-like putative cysteine protease